MEISGVLYVTPAGKDLFRVHQLAGCEYWCRLGSDTVILPWEGMVTDFGSIPRPATPFISRNSFQGPFTFHDTVFFTRYVLVSRSGIVGELERRRIQAAAHQENESLRLELLGDEFDVQPVRSRHLADDWLDAIIRHETKGGARLARAVIRFGLLVGSWGPWYFSKRKNRADTLNKHPVMLDTVRVREPIGDA